MPAHARACACEEDHSAAAAWPMSDALPDTYSEGTRGQRPAAIISAAARCAWIAWRSTRGDTGL